MGYAIPHGTDLEHFATGLKDNHQAVLSGEQPTIELPGSIIRSWTRSIESQVCADDLALPVMDAGELVERRATSPLAAVSGRVQRLFRDIVDDADLALGILDADGVLLWRGGSSRTLSAAERFFFVDGSDWSEGHAATTAISVALEDERATRIYGAEHYKVPLHSWYCAAAPVHDPRNGDLLGVIDLSGPARTLQGAVTAFAATIAALCERELAAEHARTLADLAEATTGHLAAARGPALVVDSDGWVAASRGIGTPRSITPPTAGSRQFVPGIGMCEFDQVGDGWLVRPAGSAREVVAELDLRGEPALTIIGDDPWRRLLTRRHAQLLLLLADAGPNGVSAATLSRRMFGDDTHLVSVRAEMSRLRRAVGTLVSSRPYRLTPGVTLRITPTEITPTEITPTEATPSDATPAELTTELTPVEPAPPRTPLGGRHQRRP